MKDRCVYCEDVFVCLCLCVNEQAKRYLMHEACGEMKAANRHRQWTSLTQWPTDTLAYILGLSHTDTLVRTHNHATMVTLR